jgi:predicted glycosyltransferase
MIRETASGRRILYYAHDSFGLGHLRRTLAIAEPMSRQRGVASQLVVTGSPATASFPWPARTDFVKLPVITKDAQGAYASRDLPLPLREACRLRGSLLLAAGRHYAPDLVLVDHSPLGLGGEALPLLRFLKARRPHCRLVLGLRDVIDEPRRVRQAWRAEGVYEALNELYDQILVYGDPAVVDVARDYGLPDRAARKLQYVGYLRRQAAAEPEPWPVEPGGQRVLVTAGGGGDAAAFFHLTAGALARLGRPGLAARFVTGPFLPPAARAALEATCAARPDLRVEPFANDLVGAMAQADLVISMGGYNSSCEILSVAGRALVLPRTSPRREQAIRAERLARLGLLEMVLPERTDVRRLAERIGALLDAGPAHRATPLPMDGLERTTAALQRLLDGGRGAPEAPTTAGSVPIHQRLAWEGAR